MLNVSDEKTPAGPDPSSAVVRVRARVDVPVLLGQDVWGRAEMSTFSGLSDNGEHIAVSFGENSPVPLVRVHSECLTGDVFGSGRCDCGPQLNESVRMLAESGGILLYLRQEGRGIGLYNKLDTYRIQDEKELDTFAANRALNFSDDQRDYRVAADMLRALGAGRIRMLTNNPDKPAQLATHGIRIEEVLPTGTFRTAYNDRYLRAKAEHSGHTFDFAGEHI